MSRQIKKGDKKKDKIKKDKIKKDKIKKDKIKKEDHICFEEANLQFAGYGHLSRLTKAVVKCILPKMGIDCDEAETVEAEMIDEAETAKFELSLQNDECCFLQLADSS